MNIEVRQFELLKNIGFVRTSGTQEELRAAEIHNRYDILEHLSSKCLDNSMNFIKNFSEKIINSYVLPVGRKMPEKMVKDIDKYLKKKTCINK